jgi:hypothetical protein
MLFPHEQVIATIDQESIMLKKMGLAAFFVIIMGSVPGAGVQAVGQTLPLPKADSILDAFVEKSGGREAVGRIANRRTTATMTMSMLPVPAKVTTYVTASGPFRCTIESPAVGRIEYGSDGTTVWEVVPMAGPRIKEGMERMRFQSLYGLDLPARWRTTFKSVECAGLETVGDRPAYKVTAVKPDGYTITYFFDRETGLPAKIFYPMETALGLSVQEIILDDYQAAAGTIFPYRQVRKESGREMTLTFIGVEYNVDIPEGTFALPEAVLKLKRSGK